MDCNNDNKTKFTTKKNLENINNKSLKTKKLKKKHNTMTK